MNQVQEESKSRLLKTLAVIGFIVVIIFGTWLAIQIVGLMPSAFSSLASLAEGVQSGQRSQNEITVETPESVVNSGEAFTIEWSDVKRKGSYTLWYNCVDGVSLDIRTEGDGIATVPCGKPFILPKNTFSLDAAFASAKKRFVDVPYSIGFIKAGESETFTETSRTLTLVNASIPQNGIAVATEIEDEDTEEVVEPTVTPSTPTTPSTPVTPKYKYITTYKVPTSDPNGFTDLAVTFLRVGTLTSGGKFVQKGSLDTDDRGAFQFQVKNIGTKTSGTWEFEAALTSGDVYASNKQEPLKPNEHTIITIAFGDVGAEGTRTFGAEVSGGNDTKKSNNDFTWAVKVTD